MGQFSPSTIFELYYMYTVAISLNYTMYVSSCKRLTVTEVPCKTTRERIPSSATL